MDCGKIIGTGRTATVYDYADGKVLKLFHRGYPEDAVEKEYNNTKVIDGLRFPKPRAYGIVNINGQLGILYDKITGQSLTDWVLETGDLKGCAIIMASLHKSILDNPIHNVPSYKDFLKSNLKKSFAGSTASPGEMTNLLDKLPDGAALCHGDFHPGNILISDGKVTVIDFMNICRGNYLYDIARTVFLVQYTPVPEEITDKDKFIHLKKTLADLYLEEMGVKREMIRDFLILISAARKGEIAEGG